MRRTGGKGDGINGAHHHSLIVRINILREEVIHRKGSSKSIINIKLIIPTIGLSFRKLSLGTSLLHF